MIPEVNFTRCHHFCSIVSDISSNLQDVTLTRFNYGVLGVAIDPREYCRMSSQCRKCRRRMPYALRNQLRQISARWDTFFLYQLFERFWHYTWTNKLISLYYKFLHMSCRIAMRGSRVIKSWNQGQHWRVRMKSANSRLGRLRLSDVPPSQRRHHTESSLGVVCSDMDMRHSNFYFK